MPRSVPLLLLIAALLACTGTTTPEPDGTVEPAPEPHLPGTDATVAPTPSTPADTELPADLVDAVSYMSGGRGVEPDGAVEAQFLSTLIDGMPDSVWTITPLNQRLDAIFQLSEPYDLVQLVVVNGNGDATAAKELVLEQGPGPAGPWTPITTVQLEITKVPVAFPIDAKGVRYARIRLTSNHGDAEWYSLDDIRLIGRRSNPTAVDFTGSYEGGGLVHLAQTGDCVVGCFGPAGSIEGVVEGSVMFGTWHRRPEPGVDETGRIYFAKTVEGGLSGAFSEGDGTASLRWDAERTDTEAKLGCQGPAEEAPDEIQALFAKDGRIKLYGIVFDTAKDTLKPESTVVLEALAKAIRGGSGSATYVIEGHTDDQGSEEYNQDLSERRSASVKAWLVAHEVPESQLQTAGFGETVPILPNTTPAGRAANRRVEVAVTSQ